MIFLDLVEDMARKRPRAEALRVSTGARLTYGEVWASSEVLARAISERAEFLDLVEDMARKRPRAEALRVSTGARLTYGEVWASSEVLARAISERAEPGEPVLVYGNKDPLMVVCFLACMKAGCPYVPIDCYSVPAERVAGIAGQVAEGWEEPLVLAVEEFPQTEDMPPVSVLSRRQLCDIVGKGGEADRDRWISGEDIAYILFTSGSTGAPKGVEVTADCLDNFCVWDASLARSREGASLQGEVWLDQAHFCVWDASLARSREGASLQGEVWLDQAPFSFDLSVFELVGALSTGGILYSLAYESQQSMALQMEALRAALQMEALRAPGVTIWVSTPSFAGLCLASAEFDRDLAPGLRLFIFCGETLPNTVADRLMGRFPAARVLNTYGPTESTVAVTSVEVTREMAQAHEPLPVGVPRPGTRVRVVDADGATAPRSRRSR